MDLGPLRFDFSFGTNDKPFKLRFNALILYDIIGIKSLSSTHVDWGKSLKMGMLVFYTNKPIQGIRIEASGEAYSRSFVYTKVVSESSLYQVANHEFVHILQYREYLVFNAWLKPLTEKTSKGLKNIFQNYIYLELPYFMPPYLLQGLHNVDNYYKNFYEYEAQWFSTNGYF